MRFRRINLFGGPAVGKSTQAAGIFYHLKQRGFSVELVSEIAKLWAYQRYRISSFDQVYLCAGQLHTEDTFLRDNRSDYIVTDSPLLLTVVYGRFYGLECWKDMLPIVDSFERVFPSLNIVIERFDCDYTNSGRFQNAEEAKQVDELIRNFLEEFSIPCVKLSPQEVIPYVLEYIDAE